MPEPLDFERIRQLFVELRNLPQNEQGPELARRTDGEPELREEVASLLAHHADTDDRLTRQRLLDSLDPEEIGGYRILERVGEGGMGTVYLGQRDEPIEQRVAIKLVKPGLDTRDLLRRFEYERQALARMEHPNIASVHDAGTTDDRRPYFVMEYCPGEPITAFAARRQLTAEAVLELFLQLCDGVHHAHQRGLIHRDLKPSNVLVVDVDGRPVPKIIDFGIARAIDDGERARGERTLTGQVLGTPDYMAPEQADGSSDLDTRVDVYALGVVLHELLVGTRPAKDDEGEVQRPSTTLRARRTTSTSNAAATSRDLGRDLDWILLRALATDRRHRYASPRDLAEDLRRHRKDLPVEARPPSTSYRLRKFVRRNRLGVAVGSLIAIAGSLGAAGTLVALGAIRAEQQRFDQLASVQRFEAHRASEGRLWNTWPVDVVALEAWVNDAWPQVQSDLELVRRTIGDLRAKLPVQPESGPAAAPDAPPSRTEGILRFFEEREAVVAAGGVVDLPAPRAEHRALDNAALLDEVQERTERYRSVFGEERYGLALARLLEARALREDEKAKVLLATAWAELAVGLEESALEKASAAVELAPPRQRMIYLSGEYELREDRGNLTGPRAALRRRSAELDAADAALAAAGTADELLPDEADRFLLSTLAEHEREVVAYENTAGLLARRLEFHTRERELTIDRHASQWDAIRQALQDEPGLYADEPVDLEPQLGLVPLGRNPITGLFEFYHLRSAWDPVDPIDPALLPIPVPDPETGFVDVDGDTGIVLVLIPGGRTWLGAQSTDPDGRHYDPNALPSEGPPQEIRLDPYLLARHELTQGQWRRLSGMDDSRYRTGFVEMHSEVFVTEANPADSLSNDALMAHLPRFGLGLPTAGQWEHAARAGAESRFTTGSGVESLEGSANVLDKTAREMTPWTGDAAPWSDDSVVHMAVDRLEPNAFGLHHVHGNLAEWLRDPFGSQRARFREGDGYRVSLDTLREDPQGSTRGGSYHFEPLSARFTYNSATANGSRFLDSGCRVFRAIQ